MKSADHFKQLGEKKIYTKTGDRGTTSTFHGRISKSDQLAIALGAIDELNSWIGVSRHHTALDDQLKSVQKNLLIIGSSLAGSGLTITATETRNLEKLIDKLTRELPKLANFIYPVGWLQVTRSVARRAEREVATLFLDKNFPKPRNSIHILKYLNRLSDALFTLARWTNFKAGIEEEVWK
ncbi:MAG: cob(I)yrinic acid a,c-diamide adenosyltransferase [bacterium]|nr:cob(I)yrinic acid a,c-diamide adenosyltransferase [bacterium]